MCGSVPAARPGQEVIAAPGMAVLATTGSSLGGRCLGDHDVDLHARVRGTAATGGRIPCEDTVLGGAGKGGCFRGSSRGQAAAGGIDMAIGCKRSVQQVYWERLEVLGGGAANTPQWASSKSVLGFSRDRGSV